MFAISIRLSIVIENRYNKIIRISSGCERYLTICVGGARIIGLRSRTIVSIISIIVRGSKDKRSSGRLRNRRGGCAEGSGWRNTRDAIYILCRRRSIIGRGSEPERGMREYIIQCRGSDVSMKM